MLFHLRKGCRQKKKGLSEKLEGHNEESPRPHKVDRSRARSPPALWAQDPPPCQRAAGLKELQVHPRLGAVINGDMSNDGRSSEETRSPLSSCGGAPMRVCSGPLPPHTGGQPECGNETAQSGNGI